MILLLRFANNLNRRLKTFFLTCQPPLLTPLYFKLLQYADRALARRKQSEVKYYADILWRQGYLSTFGTDSSRRLFLQTEHPIAYASDDCRLPRGAISDNSRNPRFNVKLYQLLGSPETIYLMDFGCAGGGFVRSMLEDGHVAIGLEGSDAAKKALLGEWGNIPHHLFTCDITKDFVIYNVKNEPVTFDVITAWEVAEHIPEGEVKEWFQRIARHLRPGGYFICSIDLLPDGNPLTGAVYHKTLRSADWWRAQIREQGFEVKQDHPFAMEDFVRGNGSSLKDWVPNEKTGIHIVAQLR